MAAPAIYRSTDTNAPTLFGGPGSLITLLDAILVNGYGSAFASGTITNDGTNVADGDTVTVGSITYTFRTSIAAQPPNAILIGGSANVTTVALANALLGLGASSSTGTLPNPDVYVVTPTGSITNTLAISARKGGASGNSLALSRTSAGTPHLTLSGATLTGGGGTDSKTSAGWTKPYTGTSWQQATYRQPAGCRFYLQADDTGPGTGGARDVRTFGWEAMTAYNTGSGQFPTPTQNAAGSVIRKSTTLDNTTRPWIAFVDDRTFYLFTFTGDSGATVNYHGYSFGDFYSLGTDAYKCLIMGGPAESATGQTASQFGQQAVPTSGLFLTGHYLPRNYSGFGGSTAFTKAGDIAASNNTSNFQGAFMTFPNPIDGGLYLAPLRIYDGTSPGSSLAGAATLRGRVRGMYHICHPVTAFGDGDTFTGVGEYAGRTFQVVKFVYGTASSVAFVAIETTAWETSI